MEGYQELIRNTSLAVAVTSATVSEEQFNAQRTVIIIQNTSTAGQKISIAVANEAVVGQGIVLSPGGNYQDSMDGQGYKPSNEAIAAIADAAGATVSIHERVLMRGF